MTLTDLRCGFYLSAIIRRRPLLPPSDKSRAGERWSIEENVALRESIRLGETLDERCARVPGRQREAVAQQCVRLKRRLKAVADTHS